MYLRNAVKSGRNIFLFLAVALLFGLYVVRIAFPQDNIQFYSLSPAETIIKKGPSGSFDNFMVHTMSIVELNKNGYRFWGYYTGRDDKKTNTDMALAYSNDLINWVKEDSSPVIKNLRWGTAVVVDGIINMFGTRNYGGDTYIVRLTSQDGKNFKEEETVVSSVSGEKHQNPFIFYDEQNQLYRLYYFHLSGKDNLIEEKHSEDITKLANSPANLVMSDSENILAAPAIFYRDNKYWLTTETFRSINGVQKWETLAFASDNPIGEFKPVDNNYLLIDDDACFFPYIFDNMLSGVYSHKYADNTWELYRRTHNFVSKNQIFIGKSSAELRLNEQKQLKATVIFPQWSVKNATASATWASSDNSIVTVQKGEITAKKEGSAIITVSYGGVSATKLINVISKH